MKPYASSRDLPPSFKTMADASEFIFTLRMQPSSEVTNFFILQMVIPCLPSMLIEARWEDFYLTNNTWCFKRGGKLKSDGNFSTDSIISLSKYAVNHLNMMLNYAGGNQFLFPSLQGMKKSERTTFMRDEIQKLWLRYFIDLDGFRYFFAHMAAESGYFQPKFIKSAMSGKPTDPSVGYHLVSRTLVEWWGQQLFTTTPTNMQFNPNLKCV